MKKYIKQLKKELNRVNNKIDALIIQGKQFKHLEPVRLSIIKKLNNLNIN